MKQYPENMTRQELANLLNQALDQRDEARQLAEDLRDRLFGGKIGVELPWEER